MGPSMRILLVDGQPLFLDALSNLLRATWADGEFVSHTSAAKGLEAWRAQSFDLALISVETLNASGIGAQNFVAVGAPVVLTSSSFDAAIMSESISAGARGYIAKTIGSRAIIGAVEVVTNGGVCYPSEALSVLAGIGASSKSCIASNKAIPTR